MKTDSKTHHEDGLGPDDERPEVKMAKAIEALGEPRVHASPAEVVEPIGESRSAPAVVSSAPEPATSNPEPATSNPEPSSSDTTDGAPPSAASARPAPAPTSPVTHSGAAAAPSRSSTPPLSPEAKRAENSVDEREPAAVGKPGAPKEPDDLG
jgi:hypothetical protein